MNKISLSIFVVSAMVGFLANPAFSQMGGMNGMGNMGQSMVRHRYFMMNGIPPAYQNVKNPVPDTQKNIEQGGKLYQVNCASCHGPRGHGDGPAGRELNPPPPDIASISRMPMATDSYLFWTISEGGVELRTAMPPFKNTLSPDERWKIIWFLRNRLPGR